MVEGEGVPGETATGAKRGGDPLEGAAAIRHSGTHEPAEVAWEQRIGAHSLADLGFIDVVVRESEPDWVAAAARAVVRGLAEVAGAGTGRRVERFRAWITPRTD